MDGDGLWLPLGSADLIDWKRLGGRGSQKGASAWVGGLRGDTIIVRTWTEETTTNFEFFMPAYQDFMGEVIVLCERPETGALRVTVNVEVTDRVSYTDTQEFREHPGTGLFGATLRTVEIRQGEDPSEIIPSFDTKQVEILEFAPESALCTACGDWMRIAVAHTIDQLMDAPPADDEVPTGDVEEPDLSAASRRKRDRKKGDATSSNKAAEVSDAEEIEEDEHEEEDTGGGDEPPEAPPTSQQNGANGSPGRLICTNNEGQKWEVDSETYIGRSKQCAIVLRSQRVSRKHALIEKDAAGFFLKDLGAANGVWSGTEKIEREFIQDGDEFIIGDELLTFTYA